MTRSQGKHIWRCDCFYMNWTRETHCRQCGKAKDPEPPRIAQEAQSQADGTPGLVEPSDGQGGASPPKAEAVEEATTQDEYGRLADLIVHFRLHVRL